MNLALDHGWALWLLPLLLLPVWRSAHARVDYPWLALLPDDPASTRLEALLRALAFCALAATLLGTAGLHRPAYEVERIGQGAHMVLLVDRSVSMDQALVGYGLRSTVGGVKQKSKGDEARRLLADFVARRQRDLFGMVAFSTFAIPVLPLTQKHDIVQAAIAAGDYGRGLADTDIGSGLLAALGFFAGKPFTGSRIILLVSDGAGEIDAATRSRLAHGFRLHRVALYWIYIRTRRGPTLENNGSDDDSLPERTLHAFFESLDSPYRAYTAESHEDLQHAVADVGRLQNLPIRYHDVVARLDLSARCFLAAGVLMVLLLIVRLLTAGAWQR